MACRRFPLTKSDPTLIAAVNFDESIYCGLQLAAMLMELPGKMPRDGNRRQVRGSSTEA